MKIVKKMVEKHKNITAISAARKSKLVKIADIPATATLTISLPKKSVTTKVKHVVPQTSSSSSSSSSTSDIILHLRCSLPSSSSSAASAVPAVVQVSSGDLLIQKARCHQFLYHNPPPGYFDHKKSACFWCTCDFPGDEYLIPSSLDPVTNDMKGYGCFCSPQCALAYLHKEKMDDSLRFEQEHLLNYCYGDKITRIRPAPDPYLLLDKFKGTLTPDEFHELSRSSLTLTTLQKPLTRQLPEMCEINDEFLVLYYGGNFNGFRNGFRARRAGETVAKKTNTVFSQFGISRP